MWNLCRPSTRAGCWTPAGTSWPSWKTCRLWGLRWTICVSFYLVSKLAIIPSPPPLRWLVNVPKVKCSNSVPVISASQPRSQPACNGLFWRFTPTASTSARWWWSTKPRRAVWTRGSPPTGWRTNWPLTTATSPSFPCSSASPSSACLSRPPTRWSWWALGRASLLSWASSRREAGSKSKVFTLIVVLDMVKSYWTVTVVFWL